jgi:phosphatidylserine/phosphatidylglycerophosphate/cardiolipin synthase-like enzyme
MRATRDDLKNDLLSVLEAGRELSPSNDEDLAELFLSRWEASRPTPRPARSLLHPSDPSLYALFWALAILIAIPIVGIVETYSSRDGYLPPLDPGAMPVLYWIALVATVLLLVAKTASRWMGWNLQVHLQRSDRQA